ncbi:MAG: protein phosphatase 2C domain-containing protein [Lachnospiraceae bacterium]|nr:protein phosphatase 2C domain-containing protein [Lachnospiraceae bacterium]
MATADTDTGNHRKTNQDSLLIRHADTPEGEVLLCVVCDGMGGLSRGELASATAVRAVSDWFDRELQNKTPFPDLRKSGEQWGAMLAHVNRTLLMYGEKEKINLGTTFSGILFYGGSYLICHVGDSRIYHIDTDALQLTEDQTVVAREVRAGILTEEQARADERRNVLLQCVGASPSIRPQMIYGKARPGVYLLCSDGLCHETREEDMQRALRPDLLDGRQSMHGGARHLIDLAKSRGESDNITAVVVRVQGGSQKRAGGRCG